MFRWIAVVVLASTLTISARQRRRARRETGTIKRSRETAGLVAGRLAVALPLFGSVLLYLVHPPWMGWAEIALPAGLRWLGAVLGILVVPAAWWVFTTIGANVSETILTKDHHQLVTSGPYGRVRHPLYAVGIGLFTSIGLMAGNLFILVWTLVALAAVRLVVIPREESALIEKFGDDYRTYRSGTGALAPRFRRPGSH